MNNNDIINALLTYESSEYVNNPLDRGGPTKYGITAKTLGSVRNLGRAATVQEVQALTVTDAQNIYLSQYITTPKFNLIKNDAIRWFMVDSGVVHGPVNPINWLQIIIGAPKDGVFGPQTNQLLEDWDPMQLLVNLQGARGEAIARLVTRDVSQTTFIVGWMTRLNDLCARAAKLLVQTKKVGLLGSLIKGITS